MNKILIADAGSTKVEWAVADAESGNAVTFVTDGLNALLCSAEEIEAMLSKVEENLPSGTDVSAVYYYGAGCATPEICTRMEKAFKSRFPEAQCQVSSDLLGAARSLFGSRKGIACILGTGSNSCLYDGHVIVEQIPSLGYVMGDEGSGAALGKRLVSDAFKRQLPEALRDKFLAEYSLSLPEILERVYRQPAPNKFLASFVPFLKQNLWNPYIYSLVLQELTRFVSRNVAMYPGAHSVELSFTGSIAYHFANILREAAAACGLRVAEISEAPMAGLVRYHTTNI